MAVQNKKLAIPGIDNIPGFVNFNVSEDQLIADAAARGIYAKTDEAGNLLNKEQVQSRLSQPGQDIGMPAGSEKADGKIYNGLEELDGSKDRTVKNTYVKLPDGTVKSVADVAKPEKADAVSAAGALPLFVDREATRPAMTRDAAGQNKPALLMNATLDNGHTTFQTLTADEAKITGDGGQPSSAIGNGALNVMNVYGKMAPELAQAKKAEIEETRYKDTDPKLKYNLVNKAKTSEAQAKEDARMAELNDKRMNNYYELIAKHPEMADNESNRAYNQSVRDYNAKINGPNDHLTTGFVPSWIDKSTLLPGENYVNGMLVNAISTPKEERMLIGAPEQLKGRTVDPIMDTDEIGGAKVPRSPSGIGSGPDNTNKGYRVLDLTSGTVQIYNGATGANAPRQSIQSINESFRHPGRTGSQLVQSRDGIAMSNFNAFPVDLVGKKNIAGAMFSGSQHNASPLELRNSNKPGLDIIYDMVYNTGTKSGGTKIEQIQRGVDIVDGLVSPNAVTAAERQALLDTIKANYKIPDTLNWLNTSNIYEFLRANKGKRTEKLHAMRNVSYTGTDARLREGMNDIFNHMITVDAAAREIR